MCSVDDAEPWTVYSETWRRAAKEHRCSECGRAIAKGERYRDADGLCDGYWFKTRTCEHCEAAGEWLVAMCGGFLAENMLGELSDHWDEGYRDVGLYFLIDLGTRDWRGRDGELVDPAAVARWAKLSARRHLDVDHRGHPRRLDLVA